MVFFFNKTFAVGNQCREGKRNSCNVIASVIYLHCPPNQISLSLTQNISFCSGFIIDGVPVMFLSIKIKTLTVSMSWLPYLFQLPQLQLLLLCTHTSISTKFCHKKIISKIAAFFVNAVILIFLKMRIPLYLL